MGWRQGGPGRSCGEGLVPEVPVILLPNDPWPGHEGEQVMGLVMRNQRPTQVGVSVRRALDLGHPPPARPSPPDKSGRSRWPWPG